MAGLYVHLDGQIGFAGKRSCVPTKKFRKLWKAERELFEGIMIPLGVEFGLPQAT